MANAYEVALAALAEDIRAVDGNHDLGAGELADALIQRGWTRPAWVTRFPSDYTVGRPVEIIDASRGADWTPAVVSGSVGATVQVDTDRGPRTIGSPRLIRPIF